MALMSGKDNFLLEDPLARKKKHGISNTLRLAIYNAMQ